MPERLLILNPGSTSTKAAVYDGTRPLFSRSITHVINRFLFILY